MADKPLAALLKEMAELYADREGECYLREAETLKPWPGGEGRLDAKMKRKRMGQKYRWRWIGGVSAAAVVTVAVWLTGIPKNVPKNLESDSFTADYSYRIATPAIEYFDETAPVPEAGILLRNAAEPLLLPAGFIMVGMDFDDEKIVYAVESDTQNPITVCVEPLGDTVFYRESPFREIVLAGGNAYVWVKKEYSVLLWESEGRLFTLTSPYDYRDLIILGESLLL